MKSLFKNFFSIKSRSIKTLLIGVLLLCIASCHKDVSPNNIIYQNALAIDDNTWVKVCSSQQCFKYDQGSYSITEFQPNTEVWAYTPCGLLNSTFSMNVDCAIHLADPTKWGAAGIVFNVVDNTNYKMFLISSLGHYKVFKKYGSAYTILQDWTPSSVIKTGDGVFNTISIQQKENTAEFFVNGTSLGVLSCSQSFNFKVGLTAATSLDTTNVTGSFKNLVIKKLP